jgi:hypothetical protein
MREYISCERIHRPIKNREDKMTILEKIKEACENCIEDGNEAIEEVTDGSEDIYEGRIEFASQILSLIESFPRGNE